MPAFGLGIRDRSIVPRENDQPDVAWPMLMNGPVAEGNLRRVQDVARPCDRGDRIIEAEAVPADATTSNRSVHERLAIELWPAPDRCEHLPHEGSTPPGGSAEVEQPGPQFE